MGALNLDGVVVAQWLAGLALLCSLISLGLLVHYLTRLNGPKRATVPPLGSHPLAPAELEHAALRKPRQRTQSPEMVAMLMRSRLASSSAANHSPLGGDSSLR